jgi:hypothetical protein
MEVVFVGSQERLPSDFSTIKLPEEIAPHISDCFPQSVFPLKSRMPVTPDFFPEPRCGSTEAGMRLRISKVLKSLDGDEWVFGQLLSKIFPEIGNRKRITVGENQDIIVTSRTNTGNIGQQIEFRGMILDRLGGAVCKF